jgi:23S rRNA (pseudouridine1915-N3)-methyltransferase
MKIKIIAVGKIKDKYLSGGINEYLLRLTSYIKVHIIEVPDEKAPENLTVAQLKKIKATEGEKILAKISPDDYIVGLAIEGRQKSSTALSEFFNHHMTYDGRDLVFIIGGSNGLSDVVLKRANLLLSFSKMTFPHQLMRLILLEQIYRSYKIIRNEPYHK